MPILEQQYPSVEAAAAGLSDELAKALRGAITSRGRAVLAVSGGRTPVHVFRRLRGADVDWDRVTLTLTDERWVPPDHPDSNERLVRSELVEGLPGAPAFVPLYGGEGSPEQGWAPCEERLGALSLPLDAAYLGIGPDGHFASLFPGDPALDVRQGRCTPVPGRKGGVPRMSLTAPVIQNARSLFLLFAGEEKRAAFQEAKEAGSYSENPLRLVLSERDLSVSVFAAP